MNGKISNLAQIASIRRYICTEGGERGLEVLDCNNGTIRFLLNISKACDIMQLYHEGQNISFISKNGFTKRETDFLSRFEGGLLYTCGLDSLGRRTGYEMHGTFHNIPAQIVSAKCDEQGLEVQAIIQDTALFGKNLVMYRKISTRIQSNTVELEDTLVNEGYKNEEYCLLYHINLGYPMLDNGANIIAKAKSVMPTNAWAQQNIDTVFTISDCCVGADETCYYLELQEPTIALENNKSGKRVSISYSNETLPCFLEWKSMASGDYALGLEPCTTRLDNCFSCKTIKPNEKVVFQVKFKVSNIVE